MRRWENGTSRRKATVRAPMWRTARCEPPMKKQTAHARGGRRWAIPALVAALMLAAPGTASAAAGDLDTTFSGDGKTVVDLGGSDGASAVALAPDGKIVTAGLADSRDTAVARFNADGSPDASFSGDGSIVLDVGGFGRLDRATGVAVQADGKIVIGGTTNGALDTMVARFNPDGSLDTGFSGDGRVVADLGTGDRAGGVGVQADGKIVTTGIANGDVSIADTAVARFTADGVLDSGFAGDGTVVMDLGGIDGGSDLVVQADGKIVVAGIANGTPSTADTFVLRLTGAGVLDSGFSGDGRAIVDLGGLDAASDVVLQADGKIVTGGGAGNDTVVARFEGTDPDATPPVITPTVTGTLGGDGWHTSDVGITWAVTDAESAVTASSGCDPASVTADTVGVMFTCSATSAGGSASVSASVKRDATAPEVTVAGGPDDGASYMFGSVPAAPTCSASDATSGVTVAGCTVSGYSAAAGSQAVTSTASDVAGNTTTVTRSYVVQPWTLKGFFAPVDLPPVVNTIKGGSTVPLKFEVFAGSTELTDPAAIGAVFSATAGSCTAGGIDEVEFTTTGSTALRYADGQFVQNWKTPRSPGTCFTVTVSTADGSSLTALFRLK